MATEKDKKVGTAFGDAVLCGFLPEACRNDNRKHAGMTVGSGHDKLRVNDKDGAIG
jgi:hypothetical protein